ncbi:hypothetical protein RHGRI_000597 [Rhododendron griersonianum]|uniref:FAR1 domain-containing protein n=1 Tax=Rhododendron griersonianum TaxID=479676 RepID=A0AAV6LHL9_9ERIC|nr:hypothetical protein RHGRI_000597 [Rhododendron griersonianum]
MFFETIEEARKCYENYGRQNGFWIRKYVAKIENDGVVEENDENDETEKDGKGILKKRARSCSTVKCGCKAHLLIKYDKWSCKWKVTVFTDAHNHPLVTPSKRMRMKSNRHMPKAVKNLTETFHRENLGIFSFFFFVGLFRYLFLYGPFWGLASTYPLSSFNKILLPIKKKASEACNKMRLNQKIKFCCNSGMHCLNATR